MILVLVVGTLPDFRVCLACYCQPGGSGGWDEGEGGPCVTFEGVCSGGASLSAGLILFTPVRIN